MMLIFSILLGVVALVLAAFTFVLGESRHLKQKKQLGAFKQLIEQKIPQKSETTLISGSETNTKEPIEQRLAQDVQENDRNEDIPEGAKFIVQGIPYSSYAQGARDMNCDSAYLRDCIVFKPGSPYGTTFDKFIENRMKPNNIDKFKQSTHYNNVVRKFGFYPPPDDVELLVICEEGHARLSKDSDSPNSESHQMQCEELPKGTKFVIQGIPYRSKAEIADSMDCDRVHLGDAINFKEGSKWGMPFKQFMENRLKPRSKARFVSSDHYRRVVEKYGSYPPPEDVELLVDLEVSGQKIEERQNSLESKSESVKNSDDIPVGTQFIIQGIPYPSKAKAGRDMRCDPVHLGDSINNSPHGIPFERFMENRMSTRNKEIFEQSVHYKKVVEKYGSYPPPNSVPLLVICDKN